MVEVETKNLKRNEAARAERYSGWPPGASVREEGVMLFV